MLAPLRMRRLLLAGLLACSAVRLDAQVAGARAGRLDTLVTATEDTSQHYAVYLPSAYDPARRWPVLFVLDPRGRARMALELFRPSAERLGYVVLSSYESRSDTSDTEINMRAANALLGSAQDRYAVDLRRLYFAGFSGTARDAIRFAIELRGQVAGVIGAGAGASVSGVGKEFAKDTTFSYFAVAGTEDFNHDEVRSFAAQLDSARVAYRLAIFDGPHSWPPDSVCDDALEWLTLRAMRTGRARADSAWIAAGLDVELAQAARLESEGRWDAASRLFAAIGRDYAPSPRAAEAARRAAELEAREPLRQLRAKLRDLAREEEQHALDVRTAQIWYRTRSDVPPAEELLVRLGVSSLRRQLAQGDSLDAPAVRRMLARTIAVVAFYEPRSLVAAGSYAKAARMMEVATTLAPLRGDACLVLAELRRRSPASITPVLESQCR